MYYIVMMYLLHHYYVITLVAMYDITKALLNLAKHVETVVTLHS